MVAFAATPLSALKAQHTFARGKREARHRGIMSKNQFSDEGAALPAKTSMPKYQRLMSGPALKAPDMLPPSGLGVFVQS